MHPALQGLDFARMRRAVCRHVRLALGLPQEAVVFAGQGSPEPASGPWVEVRRVAGPTSKGQPTRETVLRPASVLFEVLPPTNPEAVARVRICDAVLEARCGDDGDATTMRDELLARFLDDLLPGRVTLEPVGEAMLRAAEADLPDGSGGASTAGAIWRAEALEGAEATDEDARWLAELRQGAHVRFLLVAHAFPAGSLTEIDGAGALSRVLDALREEPFASAFRAEGFRRVRGQGDGPRYSPRTPSGAARSVERHEVDLWVAGDARRCLPFLEADGGAEVEPMPVGAP